MYWFNIEERVAERQRLIVLGRYSLPGENEK
jgi:hypothetical protein